MIPVTQATRVASGSSGKDWMENTVVELGVAGGVGGLGGSDFLGCRFSNMI